MGGRKKIYTNLNEISSKESVTRWIEGLTEGHSRRHAIYSINRYIIWRTKNGLQPDPESWVAECRDGTVRTLTEHLKILQDWVRSSEFEGTDNETRRKHYFRIRGFYEANFVPLPAVKLKLPSNGSHRVGIDVTASKFLEMARRVLSGGKLDARDKSVILTMIQSGMDASTLADVFNFVGYPQLTALFGTEDFEKWDTAECPIRIDLMRPKSDHRFFSFVDHDALEALKDWLRVRIIRHGPIKIYPQASPTDFARSDPIYLTRYGGILDPYEVGHIFRDSGKRAGVNVHVGPKPGEFRGLRYVMRGTPTRFEIQSEPWQEAGLTL